MKTYRIMLGAERQMVKDLFEETGVCAEERKSGPVDIYFVSPNTINNLPDNAPVAMVIIPEGNYLSYYERRRLEMAFLVKHCNVVMVLTNREEIKHKLQTWFEPKIPGKKG